MFKPKTPWQYRMTLAIIVIVAVIAYIIYQFATLPPQPQQIDYPPQEVPVESQQ